MDRLRAEMSNMTDEELQYSIDPTLPKPPPRSIIPGPCECYVCSQQFRTTGQQKQLRNAYSHTVDNEQARLLVAEHTNQITSSLDYLREECAEHATAIAKRWRKKSRDKREEVLLGCKPDLEPKQWMILRFFNDNSTHNWQLARESRDSWLLPWLDVESLKEDPARLLGLLNNRTRFSPEDWASHDNEVLMFGYNQGFLAIDYNPLCVVMTGSKYGELVPWDESAAHRLDIIGFPRAQLILEAQAVLLTFLVQVVEGLVEGLESRPTAEGVVHDANKAQIPKLEFRRSGRLETWSSYTNQPFSEPPRFDIDALIATARAKAKETDDHLWLMQTDAPYLRRVLRTAAQAIPIHHNLINGEQEAHLQTLLEINLDASTQALWQWILEDCETIKSLQLKYADSVQCGKPLPEEYNIAIQSLENALAFQLDNSEKTLKDSFPTRSGFRELYEFRYTADKVEWRLKHGKRKDAFFDKYFFRHERLYWCIANLIDPPANRVRYPCKLVLAFLDEYLATCDKEERGRMDERLYAQLSHHATIDEMLYAVRLHRPWCGPPLTMPELLKVSKLKQLRYLESDTAEMQIKKRYGTTGGLIPLMLDFIRAYDEKAQQGEKGARQRLKRFDNVQAAQGAFWSKIREINLQYQKIAKIAKEDMDTSTALISRRAQPDFMARIAAERLELVKEIESSSSVLGKLNLAPVQTRWGSTNVPSLITTKESTKLKRRPETSSVSTEKDRLLGAEPELELAPLQPVSVRQQTYNILCGMFLSNPGSSTKMIDWDAFVTAMAEAGFSAQHSSGSAMNFEVDNLERGWAGKIVFHKPHPVAKIDPVMLRSMGRRMNRWFGWEKNTFVVKE